MSKKKPKPDQIQSTFRSLAGAMVRHEQPIPADVEAAWQAWIAGVGRVDERAKALLRAAFEVGVEAGKSLVDRHKS